MLPYCGSLMLSCYISSSESQAATTHSSRDTVHLQSQTLSALSMQVHARPAKPRSMQENSWLRKRCRVEQLLVATSRFTSSRSTAEGWCRVVCSKAEVTAWQYGRPWVPCCWLPTAGQVCILHS